jgi:dipeptidyl aminopeptidase/acylaminoacyl peptidase
VRTTRAAQQAWILDRFLGVGGIETLFRDSLGYFLEMGYEYVDLRNATEGIQSTAMFVKGLVRVAEKREEAGREAEERGHFLTARDEYHRAAKCFARAQWGIFEANERKLELHARCTQAYDKVVAYSTYPLEKVVIPFGDGHLYGLLHAPQRKAGQPCVLFCPGLDMVKEDYPGVQNNHLVDRGLVVLSLDGPGHGESRLRGGTRWEVGPEGDNYAAAATAALDFLERRDEIDGERIGVFGISQGSYWGPHMAASDPRLRACVCYMGSFYEQGFDLGQPTFKENFMYMTDSPSEDEADKLIPYVTVAGIESELRCPLLVLHGEFDELTPQEDAVAFIQRAVNAPSKQLVVYQDEFHPLGGVSPEAFRRAADWLVDELSREDN